MHDVLVVNGKNYFSGLQHFSLSIARAITVTMERYTTTGTPSSMRDIDRDRTVTIAFLSAVEIKLTGIALNRSKNHIGERTTDKGVHVGIFFY